MALKFKTLSGYGYKERVENKRRFQFFKEKKLFFLNYSTKKILLFQMNMPKNLLML